VPHQLFSPNFRCPGAALPQDHSGRVAGQGSLLTFTSSNESLGLNLKIMWLTILSADRQAGKALSISMRIRN